MRRLHRNPALAETNVPGGICSATNSCSWEQTSLPALLKIQGLAKVIGALGRTDYPLGHHSTKSGVEKFGPVSSVAQTHDSAVNSGRGEDAHARVPRSAHV
jgi:hypothetical protein